jgi:hypothetical protein
MFMWLGRLGRLKANISAISVNSLFFLSIRLIENRRPSRPKQYLFWHMQFTLVIAIGGVWLVLIPQHLAVKMGIFGQQE